MFLYAKYHIMRIIAARLLLYDDTCDVHFRGNVIIIVIIVIIECRLIRDAY